MDALLNTPFAQQGTPQPDPPASKPIILCIGVGGGGSNVVNYIHRNGIKDVLLAVANTDAKALMVSPVTHKLQLGPNLTHGLGAGARPDIGEKAAIESEGAIIKLFPDNVKMVFIAAGMGGGTGTGAAPVIAKLAKSKGLLVVGVVTSPFEFEGATKIAIAEKGIQNLRRYSDTLIIIENQRLLNQKSDEEAMQKITLSSAFALADEVFYKAVTSITDPINKPGVINVDFRDMDTILHDAGNAVMGFGIAQGKNRGEQAAKEALSSPLLRHQNIQGARRLLLTITSGLEEEISLAELTHITAYIKRKVGTDVEMMIWGHSYEKDLGSKLRVNIIASKFDLNGMQRMEPVAPRNQASYFDKKVVASHSSYSNDVGQAPKPYNTEHIPLSPTLEEKIFLFRKKLKDLMLEPGEDYQLTEKEVKERLSVPAYKRKNITLSYTPNSKDTPERYHLYPAEGSEE